MDQFKQQTDIKIESALKKNVNHCYLTLDDIDRAARKESSLVVVNAPYNTNIKVHKPEKVRNHIIWIY